MNGDGATNDLIYIPEGPSDINLEDPTQWNALNAFIEQDSYLSKNRGKIAERFGLAEPVVHGPVPADSAGLHLR